MHKKIKIFGAVAGIFALGFLSGKVQGRKIEQKVERKRNTFIGNLVLDNTNNGEVPHVYLEFNITPDEVAQLKEGRVAVVQMALDDVVSH